MQSYLLDSNHRRGLELDFSVEKLISSKRTIKYNNRLAISLLIQQLIDLHSK
jgi:hypothetical protein